MKVPDGGCVDGRVNTPSHTAIGRASRYEYAGRKPGIRIKAAIAGVPRHGASDFHVV